MLPSAQSDVDKLLWQVRQAEFRWKMAKECWQISGGRLIVRHQTGAIRSVVAFYPPETHHRPRP
jgi:hypothetical protein